MPDTVQRVQALDVLRTEIATFDWSKLTDGKRLILDAFLRIVTTEGYTAVTMRGLGRHVNMKAGSLYSHFPGGRDEVVDAALRWHFYQFAKGTIEAVESTADAVDFWKTLVDQHVRRQLQTPENDMFDLLLAIDRISQFLPTETRQDINHLVDLNAALFKGAALDMGYQGDVDLAVSIVIAILDGVHSWSHWTGDPDDVDRISDAAIRTSLSTLEAHLLAGTTN